MNKILKYFTLLSIVTIILAACTPDTYMLGDKSVGPKDLVEGIAFKIEHDATNPNIVYLKSMLGNGYTPLWNHPQGRSQEQTVTLKMPFAGTYDVQFGVQTPGGVVYGDTVKFKVNDMYAGFISDPMWTKLSGGAGKEKTWYLDLDANSVSKGFMGPLFFYGTYDSWETVTNGITPPKGADSWNWSPKYSENSWLMGAADFGSMTFDLKNGANVVINHKTISTRGIENAKYMIDTENHTMKISGGGILHDAGRESIVTQWGTIKILSLTDDKMQLAVLRDNSTEAPCLLVYNFVSKDYYDNWTPPAVADPEPTLPAGWQTDISQTVSKSIKWVLSPNTPFNWAGLDGGLLNPTWTSADKYASWTGFNAAAATNFAKFSLTMNSGNHTVTYVAPDGTSTSGTYTLDEKGVYTFTDITPNFVMCGGWVALTTTAENQWRITSVEKDPNGAVTGMWVGKRDPNKKEYMVYHLIPQATGGSNAPVGTPLAFDNSKLVFGDLETKGNIRLELYNDFGSTKTNPPLVASDVKFGKRLSVTFTLGGIVLKSGAAGTYKAALSFANPDWSVQYWGDGTGAGDVVVNGDGTYTLYFDPSAAVSNGALVFVIDIKGLASDITDMTKVTAKIDKIELF